DNDDAIRKFRLLDIAWRLIHASIVAYVRLRTRLDGGRISFHQATLEEAGEKGDLAGSQNSRRYLLLWRHWTFSVCGVPIRGRESNAPKARRGLREAKSDLDFSIHIAPRGHHVAGHFFIRLHVRQKERLFFHYGRRKLDEAAIGVDRHGLGDFFERLAGFIVAVDEYGNSDLNSRGSLP